MTERRVEVFLCHGRSQRFRNYKMHTIKANTSHFVSNCALLLVFFWYTGYQRVIDIGLKKVMDILEAIPG